MAHPQAPIKHRYRPSTPSELRRIGVPHRIYGSKWYRSSNVPCVYPSNARRDWRDEVRARRAAHSREMAAPQVFGLTGDGQHAESVKRTVPMEGGWIKTRTNDELKIALVEARYRDWLELRDRTDRRTLEADLAAHEQWPQAIARGRVEALISVKHPDQFNVAVNAHQIVRRRTPSTHPLQQAFM